MPKKYTAKTGQTWLDIAKQLNTPLQALVKANPGLQSPYGGVSMNVPSAPKMNVAGGTPPPNTFYEYLGPGKWAGHGLGNAYPTYPTTPTIGANKNLLGNVYPTTPTTPTTPVPGMWPSWGGQPPNTTFVNPATGKPWEISGNVTPEYNPAASYSGGGAYPFEWGGPEGPTAIGRNKNYGQGGKGRGGGQMELKTPISNYRVEVTTENQSQYPGVPVGSFLVRNTIAGAPYGQWVVFNPDGSLWTPGQGVPTVTTPQEAEQIGYRGPTPGQSYFPMFSQTGRMLSGTVGPVTWRR